jgi:DNA polymerase III subunit beta
MKLLTNRETLLEPLQAISGIVERRLSLPILATTLVNAQRESITFTATDLEVELVTGISQPVQEPGIITLPAKKLLDITRSLPPNSAIGIESSDSRAAVRCGKSRFSLLAVPAAEYPVIGDFEPILVFEIPPRELKGIIERTQFSMAHQDVRYWFNGLMLEIGNNRIRAVATDGHRLALSEAEAVVDIETPMQIIVPRKGIIEIFRILAETSEAVQIRVGTNHIQVKQGAYTLTSKLIDGRFPDYERVLTEKGDKIVKANRENLRQGLARTSILSNEKFKGIKIALEMNVLRSAAHNTEQEEAEEEIEVNYSGAPLEIGFNASYLLDVLSVIKTDTVRLEFSKPDRSCLIHPEGGSANCRYVVGPIRL